ICGISHGGTLNLAPPQLLQLSRLARLLPYSAARFQTKTRAGTGDAVALHNELIFAQKRRRLASIRPNCAQFAEEILRTGGRNNFDDFLPQPNFWATRARLPRLSPPLQPASTPAPCPELPGAA